MAEVWLLVTDVVVPPLLLLVFLVTVAVDVVPRVRVEFQR